MLKYSRRWFEWERWLSRWIDPRLDSVRVADLQAYLLRKGWKPVPPARPHTLVFQEPPGLDEDETLEPLYQFVPDSEAYRDYRRDLVELITLLAFIEDRYAGDILRQAPLANGADAGGAQPEGSAHGSSK